MEKTDVFVWVNGEDGAEASLAVRALRKNLKVTAGQWFLMGARSERLERLAYDLGMRPIIRPADLGGLGTLAAAHGEAPSVLFWSAEAVLITEWNPWQGNQVKIWDLCPAALLRRTDLPGGSATTWHQWQTQSSWPLSSLPASQVKVLPGEEFEKASHGSAWPFGPAVVMLEKVPVRR